MRGTKTTGEFIVLTGVTDQNRGQTFYTIHTPGDPTRGDTGEVWYSIVGYADTSDEALRLIAEENFEYLFGLQLEIVFAK